MLKSSIIFVCKIVTFCFFSGIGFSTVVLLLIRTQKQRCLWKRPAPPCALINKPCLFLSCAGCWFACRLPCAPPCPGGLRVAERPRVQPVALLSDQPPCDPGLGKGKGAGSHGSTSPRCRALGCRLKLGLCPSPALSLCGREACPPILGPGLITPSPPNKVRTKM